MILRYLINSPFASSLVCFLVRERSSVGAALAIGTLGQAKIFRVAIILLRLQFKDILIGGRIDDIGDCSCLFDKTSDGYLRQI